MNNKITLAEPGHGFPLSNLINIIDEAYQLYMPQVRSEITDLALFLQKDLFEKQRKDHDYQYNILEIGTKNGGTFYIWNKLNPNGMNISIDMTDGGIHGGIHEDDMNKRNLWFQERFQNCHFIRGNSHDSSILYQFSWKLRPYDLKDFSIPTDIDFLFIDGDHSYEGVQKDFEMYSPFVKKGGIISFHDIVISEKHHDRNVYVGEFWKELTSNALEDGICSYNGQLYAFKEFIGSEDQDWAGIGTLIKL